MKPTRREEISDILENLDLDLNIESWRFSELSEVFESALELGEGNFIKIEISLERDNTTQKILEELKYIISRLNEIEGYRYNNTYISTSRFFSSKDFRRSLKGPTNNPNYMNQFDNWNIPDESGKTHWINRIEMNILFLNK